MRATFISLAANLIPNINTKCERARVKYASTMLRHKLFVFPYCRGVRSPSTPAAPPRIFDVLRIYNGIVATATRARTRICATGCLGHVDGASAGRINRGVVRERERRRRRRHMPNGMCVNYDSTDSIIKETLCEKGARAPIRKMHRTQYNARFPVVRSHALAK